MAHEFFIQRREGALRQAAFQVEGGRGAQSRRHRQEKAQGRAAFAAGEGAGHIGVAGGEAEDAVIFHLYLRAQRSQAAGGGNDILRKTVTEERDGGPAQGGTDQEPVGLRLGGGDLYRARERAGGEGDVHTAPPAASHRGSAEAENIWISQLPMARGITSATAWPRIFLSLRTARLSASSE